MAMTLHLNPRWKRRPENSTWGDFGVDDQLGRLNLLTAAKVKQALEDVRTGEAFCLSLPLDLPGGNVLNERRRPPVLGPTAFGDRRVFNFPLSEKYPGSQDVLSDDYVILSLQYSTQWDSLAHVGAIFDVNDDGKPIMVYYNGYRANRNMIGELDLPDSYEVGHQHVGAIKLGVDTIAALPLQGRGVLVDLLHHYGPERRTVRLNDLRHAMREDGINITRGDVLVLRTGFSEEIVRMNHHPDRLALDRTGCVLDGSDPDLLDWITASGIAAICADNYAVESLSRDNNGHRDTVLPLHHHCLFKLGVPLGEMWWLPELASALRKRNCFSFLLTAPPLRLPRAVGSPVTPVATI